MTTLIEVKIISSEAKIPVKLSYVSHAGNRVKRLAGSRALYEALGLRI